jgi:hypothetical protein
MTRRKLALCSSIFCLAVPAGLFAQGVDATLKGRVADSSGAAAPGVKVEVKNTGTNIASTTLTDSAGQYTGSLSETGLVQCYGRGTRVQEIRARGLIFERG